MSYMSYMSYFEGTEMINSLAAPGGERLLFTVFVMFVAAKLAAEIFERLKQPAVAAKYWPAWSSGRASWVGSRRAN